MGRNPKYTTEEEKNEAMKKQKLECYHKNKQIYNLISKKGYYKRAMVSNPDKTEYYEQKIKELEAEILELRNKTQKNEP